MTTRTLNSTGRSRITQDMFKVNMANMNRAIDISWDLTALKIPSSSKLFLEVINKKVERRFELSEDQADSGTAQVPLPPELLTGFVSVKVVAVGRDKSGIPLIEADSIATTIATETGESSATSPLVVCPQMDLEVPWELDFTGGDVRVLVAADNGLYAQTLKSSSIFKSVIIGPIVYEIVLKMMDSDEGLGSAFGIWKTMLAPYGLDLSEDVHDWDFEQKHTAARQISKDFQIGKKTLTYLQNSIERDTE